MTSAYVAYNAPMFEQGVCLERRRKWFSFFDVMQRILGLNLDFYWSDHLSWQGTQSFLLLSLSERVTLRRYSCSIIPKLSLNSKQGQSLETRASSKRDSSTVVPPTSVLNNVLPAPNDRSWYFKPAATATPKSYKKSVRHSSHAQWDEKRGSETKTSGGTRFRNLWLKTLYCTIFARGWMQKNHPRYCLCCM